MTVQGKVIPLQCRRFEIPAPVTRVHLRNFKSKSGTRIIELLAPFGFRSSCPRVPHRITNFENRALKRVPLSWMQDSCDTHGVLPSPLWGGVGGGGSSWRMQLAP